MFKVFLKCFNWVITLNFHNFERKYSVLKKDFHQLGFALVFDCLGVVLSFKVLQEKRARQPWDLRHLLESERYFSFVSFQLRLMATWHFSFKRRKCFTLWAITRKIELSAFLSLDAKLCWHFEALFFAGKNSLFLLLELQNRKTNIRIWMLAPLSREQTYCDQFSSLERFCKTRFVLKISNVWHNFLDFVFAVHNIIQKLR